MTSLSMYPYVIYSGGIRQMNLDSYWSNIDLSDRQFSLDLIQTDES